MGLNRQILLHDIILKLVNVLDHFVVGAIQQLLGLSELTLKLLVLVLHEPYLLLVGLVDCFELLDLLLLALGGRAVHVLLGVLD